jgi:3-dehydroquinate synthetase
MMFSVSLAVHLKICKKETAKKLENLLIFFNLPVHIENKNISVKKLMEVITKDKKMQNEKINFVLPVKIGQINIVPLKLDVVQQFLKSWL